MRILLVNPHISDFSAFDLWLRPLGLLYLAAILQKETDAELYWLDPLDRFQADAFAPGDPALKERRSHGGGKYHREFMDKNALYGPVPRRYSRYGMPESAFLDRLDRLPEIDVVLMTTLMTYWVDGARYTLDHVKKRFPRARAILGGVLPTLVSREVLEAHGIRADVMVRGAGEHVVLPLLKSLGCGVRRIPEYKDLEDLPDPAVELTGDAEIAPLMTSRGCPMRCSYCASHLLHPVFSERSADHVIGELARWLERRRPRHVALFDDALLINKQRRFFPVFRWARDHTSAHFHTPNGLHARELDPETAELFFQSRFKTIRLSFESVSGELLRRSSGKVTRRQMEAAVANLEAAGYRRRDIGAYLLFGAPGQSAEDVRAALDFTASLGVTPHLSYYSPVPGTPDFLELQKQGILSTPVNLYETNKLWFIHQRSGFTPDEIQEIRTRAAALAAHGAPEVR